MDVAAPQDNTLHMQLSGVVQFEVEGVGKFAGNRLTAIEHVQKVLTRQAMMLEQIIAEMREEQAKEDPKVILALTPDRLPWELKSNIYQIVHLEVASVEAAADVPKEKWDGPRKSDPDVVAAVHAAFITAKNAAYRSDDQTVDDLKN